MMTTFRFRSRPKLALAAFLLAGLGTPAQAQAPPACLERSVILERLRTGYGEQPAAFALADGGRLVELLLAPEGATWTLLSSSPDGHSCILATGRHWITRTPEAPALESGWRP